MRRPESRARTSAPPEAERATQSVLQAATTFEGLDAICIGQVRGVLDALRQTGAAHRRAGGAVQRLTGGNPGMGNSTSPGLLI